MTKQGGDWLQEYRAIYRETEWGLRSAFQILASLVGEELTDDRKDWGMEQELKDAPSIL